MAQGTPGLVPCEEGSFPVRTLYRLGCSLGSPAPPVVLVPLMRTQWPVPPDALPKYLPDCIHFLPSPPIPFLTWNVGRKVNWFFCPWETPSESILQVEPRSFQMQIELTVLPYLSPSETSLYS